jgi:hypothetical protein
MKACYGFFSLHIFLEMKEKNQGHHKLLLSYYKQTKTIQE